METPFGLFFVVVGLFLILLELGIPGQLIGLLGAAIGAIGLAQLAWSGILGPTYFSGLLVLGFGFGMSAWAWRRWMSRLRTGTRRAPAAPARPR